MRESGTSYLIKKAFADAYMELAKEKPLRKVSISDMARYCGLSRVTFYNHFNEKHDLLLWAYTSRFPDMMKELKNYDSLILKNGKFLSDNKAFFFQAYKYTDFLDWHQNWICRNMWDFIIHEYGEDELSGSLRYQIQSYVFGAFAMFRLKLSHNEKDTIWDTTVTVLRNMPLPLREYFFRNIH